MTNDSPECPLCGNDLFMPVVVWACTVCDYYERDMEV